MFKEYFFIGVGIVTIVAAIILFVRYYVNIPYYNFSTRNLEWPRRIRIIREYQHHHYFHLTGWRTLRFPGAKRRSRLSRSIGKPTNLWVVLLISCVASLILTRWFSWAWWIVGLSPSMFWWYLMWNRKSTLRHPLTYVLFIPWLIYFILIVLMGLSPQFTV